MTIEDLYQSIGRQTLIEAGFSAQVLTDAKRRGILPASWFDPLEKLCAARGLRCPRALFKWKEVNHVTP